MSYKYLWKICSSNARAAIRSNGFSPIRTYPYCSLKYVSPKNREIQRIRNKFAELAVLTYGGTWDYDLQ